MKMVAVKSSNLAEVGYDDVFGTLHVRFHGSDGVHQYDRVPSSLHTKLLAAPSPGSFFHQNIRGKFAHTPPKKDTPNADDAE